MTNKQGLDEHDSFEAWIAAQEWNTTDLVRAVALRAWQARAKLSTESVDKGVDRLTAASGQKLTDEQIEAVVLIATKHVSDPAIRLQTDKEIRALLRASEGQA
jgi:hypothetical protein